MSVQLLVGRLHRIHLLEAFADLNSDEVQHSKSLLGIGSLFPYICRRYAREAFAGAGIQMGKPASLNPMGKGYAAKLHEIGISAISHSFVSTNLRENDPKRNTNYLKTFGRSRNNPRLKHWRSDPLTSFDR